MEPLSAATTVAAASARDGVTSLIAAVAVTSDWGELSWLLLVKRATGWVVVVVEGGRRDKRRSVAKDGSQSAVTIWMQ